MQRLSLYYQVKALGEKVNAFSGFDRFAEKMESSCASLKNRIGQPSAVKNLGASFNKFVASMTEAIEKMKSKLSRNVQIILMEDVDFGEI